MKPLPTIETNSGEMVVDVERIINNYVVAINALEIIERDRLAVAEYIARRTLDTLDA